MEYSSFSFILPYIPRTVKVKILFFCEYLVYGRFVPCPVSRRARCLLWRGVGDVAPYNVSMPIHRHGNAQTCRGDYQSPVCLGEMFVMSGRRGRRPQQRVHKPHRHGNAHIAPAVCPGTTFVHTPIYAKKTAFAVFFCINNRKCGCRWSRHRRGLPQSSFPCWHSLHRRKVHRPQGGHPLKRPLPPELRCPWDRCRSNRLPRG